MNWNQKTNHLIEKTTKQNSNYFLNTKKKQSNPHKIHTTTLHCIVLVNNQIKTNVLIELNLNMKQNEWNVMKQKKCIQACVVYARIHYPVPCRTNIQGMKEQSNAYLMALVKWPSQQLMPWTSSSVNGHQPSIWSKTINFYVWMVAGCPSLGELVIGHEGRVILSSSGREKVWFWF